MHYIQALPTILAVLLFVFLGFVVVHNQRREINRSFVAFLLADSLWLSSVFAIDFTDVGQNVYLGRFAFAMSLVLVITVRMFINKLLNLRQTSLYNWYVYACGLLVIILTMGTGLIIQGIKLVSSGGRSVPYPVYGRIFPLFLLYLAPTIAGYLFILFRQFRRLKQEEITRSQLAVVGVGIVLFTVCSLLTNLILPSIVSAAWPSEFAPVGSVVLATCFVYAIGKYRLFDIHFYVVRAAMYLTTLFLTIVVLVSPVILGLDHFFGLNLDSGKLTVSILLGVSMLYALDYLRKFFDKQTARVFFRSYYDPQDVLDELSNSLVRTSDKDLLREEATRILSQALNPDFLKYVLFMNKTDPDIALARWIDESKLERSNNLVDFTVVEGRGDKMLTSIREERIALAVKLRTTHEILGYILVGYKRSGEAYSSRDRRILSVAADEIAISLQNALRFEQIQRFNVTLQQKVDAATRKLRANNDKLRTLDQTKDDFISMASHQLRTPLTSVKGYVSMVLDGDAGPINPMQRKLLNQSFASSQRMVYLIADLLNISRLRTGKFVIEPTPTNLAEITRDEVSQLVETAKSRGLELTYDKPQDFPTYLLDTVKTRQVVMNFVDNAIYYTKSGGHIHVKLEDKPKSIELRVIDDGIGVPRALQHHLFSKFYRAPNAQKARPDGTGLGLFMAKKIVIAQGGSIIFESAEGKGSVFGFSFAKSHLQVPSAKTDRSTAY